MTEKPVFYYHFVAIFAIFVLSGGIIGHPRIDDSGYIFFSYLISGIICLSLYLLIIPLCNYLFNNTKKASLLKKIVAPIILISASIYSLFCASASFTEYINFAKNIMLFEYSKVWSVLIFSLVSAFFISRRQEDILKFFFVSFLIIFILIIIFFIALMGSFDYKNLLHFQKPNLTESLKQSKPYLVDIIFPSLLLPLYQSLVFKQCDKSSSLWGAALGFFTLGICFLGTVLLFGPELSNKLSYPFASAVSTITIGRLFTRLDGFSYFIYFSASLLRVTVCSFISFSCLKRLKKIFQPRT